MATPLNLMSQIRYADLADEYLEKIRYHSPSDVRAVSVALKALSSQERWEKLNSPSKADLLELKEVYDTPELYVKDASHHKTFQSILEHRIEEKRKELQSLSSKKKRKLVKTQKKASKKRKKQQEKLKMKSEVPDFARTCSDDEWLRRESWRSNHEEWISSLVRKNMIEPDDFYGLNSEQLELLSTYKDALETFLEDKYFTIKQLASTSIYVQHYLFSNDEMTSILIEEYECSWVDLSKLGVEKVSKLYSHFDFILKLIHHQISMDEILEVPLDRLILFEQNRELLEETFLRCFSFSSLSDIDVHKLRLMFNKWEVLFKLIDGPFLFEEVKMLELEQLRNWLDFPELHLCMSKMGWNFSQISRLRLDVMALFRVKETSLDQLFSAGLERRWLIGLDSYILECVLKRAKLVCRYLNAGHHFLEIATLPKEEVNRLLNNTSFKNGKEFLENNQTMT